MIDNDIAIDVLKEVLSGDNTKINKLNIYKGDKQILSANNIHIGKKNTINITNKKSRKNKKDNTLICDNQIYDFFRRNPNLFDEYIKRYLKNHLKVDFESVETEKRIEINLVLKDDLNLISKSRYSLSIPNLKNFKK